MTTARKELDLCTRYQTREFLGEISRGDEIVFGTDDIQRTYKELSARGVEFTQAPSEESWGSQAQFVDQDGNGFVLVG